MRSTFWTPKWGPPLATCLTILGDALCGSFRIPAPESDLFCWRKISHDQQSCWQVMRQLLCQRTEEVLYDGSGFCCEFWTPFWGSEGGLSSKDDTHSCSKPGSSHLHDFSNHPLELQHTLLKFCTSSVKLQSRKTKVSLHVSNIHVPCC